MTDDHGSRRIAGGNGGRPESTPDVTVFWSMLSDIERDALLAVADRVTYAPGTRIFGEGDPSSYVLVIEAGWVKAASGEREQETALALRRPGDLVGESAPDHSPRSATVVALHEVRSLRVTADRFSRLLHEHPAMEQALHRTHRDRRIQSDRMRVDVGNVNSAKRLAQLFLELAEHSGKAHAEGIVLDIPLSQKQFGQLICASTGTVERTLRNWRQRGIVSTRYRRHVLHDLDTLSWIAGRSRPEGASSPQGRHGRHGR